jgi:hypothetical protein
MKFTISTTTTTTTTILKKQPQKKKQEVGNNIKIDPREIFHEDG